METWISRRLEDQTPLGLCNQCFQCPYSYEMQALWEIQSSRSMGYWHYMEDNSVWCGGNSFKIIYSSNINSIFFYETQILTMSIPEQIMRINDANKDKVIATMKLSYFIAKMDIAIATYEYLCQIQMQL